MTSISTVTTSVAPSITASSASSSTTSAASATSSSSSSLPNSNDGAGITARGKAFLDQAEALFMDTTNQYSMTEKAQFYMSMGQAWQAGTGWLNGAEEQQLQKIMDAASKVGSNGFLQQEQAYENQLGQVSNQNGENTGATLSWMQGQPAWEQVISAQSILGLQIGQSIDSQLKAQDGIDGFSYAKDSSPYMIGSIKNPIAKQLLQLQQVYQDSENLPTYDQRISAGQQILDILNEMQNGGPIDTVSLSPQAQSYLGSQQSA